MQSGQRCRRQPSACHCQHSYGCIAAPATADYARDACMRYLGVLHLNQHHLLYLSTHNSSNDGAAAAATGIICWSLRAVQMLPALAATPTASMHNTTGWRRCALSVTTPGPGRSSWHHACCACMMGTHHSMFKKVGTFCMHGNCCHICS
jgi:hypothetical protein